jgi:hypothetical protein
MPVNYAEALKDARLAVTRDQLNGGTLEIGTAGFREVVARFRLGTPCAEISEGELVCGGMPKRAMATNKGPAAEARFVNAAGVVLIDGLTVGDENDEDVEVTIAPDKDVKQGQSVELMGVRIIHG